MNISELIERLRSTEKQTDGTGIFGVLRNPDGPAAADFIEQSTPPHDRVKEAREIIELYFAPWGAEKGERWEDISGDQPFNAEVALRLVLASLNKDPSHG